MPYSTVLQVNDAGIILTVTVIDSGTKLPKDISAATNIRFLLKRGNDTTLSFPGSFVSNGTDGQVKYQLQTGDLAQAGNWSIQVSYLIDGNQRYTSEDTFIVAPNL